MDEFNLVAAVLNGLVYGACAYAGLKIAFWHDRRLLHKRLDKSAQQFVDNLKHLRETLDAEEIKEGEKDVS